MGYSVVFGPEHDSLFKSATSCCDICIKMILAHVIILAGGKSCRNFSQGFSYWKVTQKFTHFARWNAKYACATYTTGLSIDYISQLKGYVTGNAW
jgi:hypothetical protein